jgi:YD repeat-containing protein
VKARHADQHHAHVSTVVEVAQLLEAGCFQGIAYSQKDPSTSITANVTYTYDGDGNRLSMVDGTGTTTYTYDELDRLLSVTSPGPKTVGYRYDRDGNRRKLLYPDNTGGHLQLRRGRAPHVVG